MTDALAQERLDFGLRENMRAGEKLTAFLELESAIRTASGTLKIVLTLFVAAGSIAPALKSVRRLPLELPDSLSAG